MPTIFVSNKTELPEPSDYDFYPTPKGLVERVLFRLIGSKLVPTLPRNALDVGANTGVWGAGLRHFSYGTKITGVEIQDMPKPEHYDEWFVGDYLAAEFSNPKQFDFIMGNPPYTINNQVIEKSWMHLKPYGVMAFLFKTNILNGVWRAKNMYLRYPPAEVWMLPRRVSFSGNKKTNADEYCIVIWKKSPLVTQTCIEWVFHDNDTEFSWEKK